MSVNLLRGSERSSGGWGPKKGWGREPFERIDQHAIVIVVHNFLVLHDF